MDITVKGTADDKAEANEAISIALKSSSNYILAQAIGGANLAAVAKVINVNAKVEAAGIDLGGQGVKRDIGDQSRYDSGQSGYGFDWIDRDGNGSISNAAGTTEYAFPVSYERSTGTTQQRLTVSPYFWVSGGDFETNSGGWVVKGDDLGISGADEFVANATVEIVRNRDDTKNDPGLYKVYATNIASTVVLGNLIWKGDWKIKWKLVKAGQQDVVYQGNGSNNKLYVTGVSAPDQFHTVLELGCSGAYGLRPHEATDTPISGTTYQEDLNVVDGVWNKFTGNSTKRVDGTEMSYSHNPAGFALDAAHMLARRDGRGQCTAWADLLVITLGAQGIAATSTRIDGPGPGPGTGFAVKSMPAQGSGGANYLIGTAPGGFAFHQVVRVGVYPDRISIRHMADQRSKQMREQSN